LPSRDGLRWQGRRVAPLQKPGCGPWPSPTSRLASRAIGWSGSPRRSASSCSSPACCWLTSRSA
jgi:hypothetical protein